MRLPPIALTAALLLAGAAHAAPYAVEPILDKGKTMGCMAINQTDGVVIVAVENSLSVIVTSPDFKVVKDDAVSGTWSIDDSKRRPLAEKANGDGIVSIDLELTKENFELLGQGDELTVALGKTIRSFSLAGSSKALADLSTCMNAKK